MINLAEDDDEPQEVSRAVDANREREVIDLLDEDQRPCSKTRVPRVGLARSELISSRARLTVPRTSGLLGSHNSGPAAFSFNFAPSYDANFEAHSEAHTTQPPTTLPLSSHSLSPTSSARTLVSPRDSSFASVHSLSPSRCRQPSTHSSTPTHTLSPPRHPQDRPGPPWRTATHSLSPSCTPLPSPLHPPDSPIYVPASPPLRASPSPPPFCFPRSSSLCSRVPDFIIVDDCPSPRSEDDDVKSMSRPRRRSISVISPPRSPKKFCSDPREDLWQVS